jgi:hypothetical protein
VRLSIILSISHKLINLSIVIKDIGSRRFRLSLDNEEGYHARLSDLINNSHHFLSLSNLEVHQKGIITMQTPLVALNQQSIIFLAEDDSNVLEIFSYIEVQLDSNL